MRDVVTTSSAPAPIGPYSQAIRTEGFVFLSGQIAIDPKSQALVSGGITRQTKQVLHNIANLLHAAGTMPEKIVRCVVYLQDIEDFGKMNEVYGEFFPGDPPARTTIAVSGLPKRALVEIEVTALV